MYPHWDFHCGHSCSQRRYRFCGLNANYYNCHALPPWRCHCRTEFVSIDKNASTFDCVFKIVLDVDNFTIEELKVKAKNQDTIIVEGNKIEENTKKKTSNFDFTRIYKTPRHYDARKAKVTLSADKMLLITVPENKLDTVEQNIDIIESTETFENLSNDTKEPAEEVLEEETSK